MIKLELTNDELGMIGLAIIGFRIASVKSREDLSEKRIQRIRKKLDKLESKIYQAMDKEMQKKDE